MPSARGKGKTGWEVCTHGGRKPTGIDALEWIKQAVEMGAGEILLTSWDADGHQAGYDNELNRAVSEMVNVPVIASGRGRHAGAPLRSTGHRQSRCGAGRQHIPLPGIFY